MTEQLELCSAAGRRVLLETPWMGRREEIERQLVKVTEVLEYLRSAEGERLVGNIGTKLEQLRDIHATIRQVGEEVVLDDLGLFELKCFALLEEEVRMLTEEWKCITLPVLTPVVELLDPEANRMPHFYIYDAYSAELTAVRSDLKMKKKKGAEDAEIDALYLRNVEIEDRIREKLSCRLVPFRKDLQNALEQMALLDIVIAKARQAKRMKLVKPVLEEGEMSFCGLFNPFLQEILQKSAKQFQPVDLLLGQHATLITGANMVGKTVLLKTVALAQCLLQFGSYVPAKEARMVVVDDLLTSIGDEQDEMNGLSSFAAEMLRIDGIVKQIRKGRRLLVCIDEPARTTNPIEGQAIVNGLVDFLTRHAVLALVTTHYNGIVTAGKRLRVKGFVEEKIQGEVTPGNIDRWIDYSLEEDQSDEVPREALRIAALLGVDKELLAEAEKFI